MEIDKEIIEEFLQESQGIVDEMLELLESIEGDFSQVARLKDFGNGVDRVMGGAKNLAVMVAGESSFQMIGDYAGLLKAVGYKASQIKKQEAFYDACVGLLLDATEVLQVLLQNVDHSLEQLKKEIPPTFIERVQWISSQFTENYSESVGSGNQGMNQSEIDDLMKKLGF